MPADQRDADAMGAARPRRFDRMRQQPEQRGAEQRAGREADEVRHDRVAPRLRQQQEAAGDQRGQRAAGGGEDHDQR